LAWVAVQSSWVKKECHREVMAGGVQLMELASGQTGENSGWHRGRPGRIRLLWTEFSPSREKVTQQGYKLWKICNEDTYGNDNTSTTTTLLLKKK